MDDLIGKHLRRFEITARLGAGGMGEVFLARDTRLKRDVAIKRMPAEVSADPERRARFLREARSGARISHQHVAALYDAFEEDGELYLVMEHVEGRTLRAEMSEPMSLPRALDVITQCAEGLSAAHRQGVVHGDIKPENAMVTTGGQVKILDFGVSRLMRVSGDSAETQTQTYVESDSSAPGGTLAYMAPEALLGHAADHRVDIFALGVILYQMLTEHHPFAASTPTAVGDRILHQNPLPVLQLNPQVPERLGPILDKMLAKSAEERFATTDDLLVDLRAVKAGLSAPFAAAAHQSSPASLLPGAQRRRALWPWGIFAAAWVVALAVLVGRSFLPSGEPASPGSDPPAAAEFRASDFVIAALAPSGAAAQDDELRTLNEGLAATLTTKLTQLTRAHDLQVIPSSTLRDRRVDSLRSARQELGVTLALSFETHRAGNQVRVNIGLVDTREERQLDAALVDGSLDNPIDLEEQVAVQAIRMLRLELRPMEQVALAMGTDDPRAHGFYLRARGYLQEYGNPGSIDDAVTLLERSLRIDPQYARAHAALGEAYWQKHRDTNEAVWVTRAEKECQAALAIDELEATAHGCLGNVYNATGRYDEAVTALDQARRLDPTRDEVYVALGQAYQSLGQPALAEATYQEAIALRPHYWAGHSWLGAFYFRQGRYEEAGVSFEQVVLLAPDSYRGFSNLGAAYYQAERWVDARRAFERAIAMNPDYGRAFSNLGTLYFYEGRFDDSARSFERAVELTDNSYLAWGNLGDAYAWGGSEGARAENAYQRAVALVEDQLEVNPNDAYAQVAGAWYHAMLGDEPQALEHVERALALAAGDVDVHHDAAQVFLRLGDRTRAREQLRAALEGGYTAGEVRVDPLLADLRDDPVIRALLER